MQLEATPAELLRDLERLWAAQESREAWAKTARPEQLTPLGAWSLWLILAGRGWGKTRTGAEDVGGYGQENPGSRIAVIAPTIADARDTCVEGESGLLSVIPRHAVATWNRSIGELILNNGTRYKLFSAEEPERLRGPQHHRAWADELAAWKNQQATWDQLMFGLRLGQDPRVIATTTPKPTPLIRRLVSDPTTLITKGSTFDNAANLAPAAIAQLRARYEGTRLGRQELEAELLTDTPGALWTRAMVEAAYCETVPAMRRVVVAVDPSGSDGETGDLQGIVVCGLGMDDRGYVLEDGSIRGSPDEWGRQTARLFEKHRADRVVAERNFGGAMVESVLRTAAPNLPVTLVTASRGKAVRAEPIAALYEQGRIGHLKGFPELEDQLCEMTTGGFVGSGSPDRLDAMVWGFSELFVTEPVKGAMYLEIARREMAAKGMGLGAASAKPAPYYAPGSVEWNQAQLLKQTAGTA
jgi:phage terminase large subunit-like protein